jgi:hypothetical protein
MFGAKAISAGAGPSGNATPRWAWHPREKGRYNTSYGAPSVSRHSPSASKVGNDMPTSAIDAPLTVSTDGTAGPYVIVTPNQYSAVAEALRTEGVRFHVDQDAVLLGGGTALAVIDLGIGADVERIQRILDRVSEDLGQKRRHGRPPMRKELVVRGDAVAMKELRRRLEVEAVGEWGRRHEIEERFRKTLPQHTSAYCFSKQVPAIGRPVVILMQGRGPGEGEDLYLAGVFPVEGREALGLDQHDLAVADFRNTVVGPLSRDLGVRILDCSAPAHPSLEEMLSPEALARLKSFSAAANKGMLHEPDMRRWASFIEQTHRDDDVVDSGLLEGWLADEGFPKKQRSQLVREYESGRRLLSAYDEERR